MEVGGRVKIQLKYHVAEEKQRGDYLTEDKLTWIRQVSHWSRAGSTLVWPGYKRAIIKQNVIHEMSAAEIVFQP